jgi:hypothetical protein
MSETGLGCVKTPELNFANGDFVSTSINLKNKSAGDGRGDKTIEKTILRTFRARTFSRSQGQSRPKSTIQITSAYPPRVEAPRTSLLVRLVPTRDIDSASAVDST